MKKVCKENKGITLVALVITIIVLLILASITAAALTGENGIIAKGNSAKLNTEQASILEQLRLEVQEKTLDMEGNKSHIEYLKTKGIIEEETNVGVLGKYASMIEISQLNHKKIAATNTKTRDKRFIVKVDKLLADASTGKGDYNAGDVYYILNGDLYYMSKIKENKMVGTVFSVAKANISYFNYTTTNEEAQIIGLNLNNIPHKEAQTSTGYASKAYTLLMEELIVPSQIDGKPVTEVSFDKTIGSEGETSSIEFGGVKAINYPNTLKILKGDNAIFSDIKTIYLPEGLEKIQGKAFYFSDKVEQITIPSTVKIIEGTPFSGWNHEAIINVAGKQKVEDFESCSPDWSYYLKINFLGK